MLLLNFRFDDLQIEKNNLNNNLVIFKWVLFDDFHPMLLQELKISIYVYFLNLEFILCVEDVK